MHSISGFYYVEAADSVFECKAKGSFRNQNISPLVGDIVDIKPEEDNGGKGVVTKIHPRKNYLLRPPVANLDRLIIVSSVDKPRPNLFVIDKLTAFAVRNGIEPVIVFSKSDLGDPSYYMDIYRRAGFLTLCSDIRSRSGIDRIGDAVRGKLCAFSGNSGVGKSSIINCLLPELELETNIISEKLGRGKHTTRSVRLYRFEDGFIADTPGFSSFELINDRDKIMKEDLADCFPEFLPFTDGCRFGLSCSHIRDKGCAVLEAVADGRIPEERHESYVRMYEEVRDLKSWDKT